MSLFVNVVLVFSYSSLNKMNNFWCCIRNWRWNTKMIANCFVKSFPTLISLALFIRYVFLPCCFVSISFVSFVNVNFHRINMLGIYVGMQWLQEKPRGSICAYTLKLKWSDKVNMFVWLHSLFSILNNI